MINKDTLDTIWGVIQYVTGVLIVVTVITLIKMEEAHAADVLAYENGYIGIIGSTEMTDISMLIVTLDQYPNTHTIVVGGDGGYAIVGVAIAHLVYDRGLNTHATSDCYSACALIWTAGRIKSTAPNVGVYQHGIYNQEGAEPVTGESYNFWYSVLNRLYDKIAPEQKEVLLPLLKNKRNELLKLN